jgi:hypothetical protein
MSSLDASDAAAAAVAVAPRVALADIEAKIAATYYVTGDQIAAHGPDPVFAETQVITVCLLVMANGFTVIGKSAPASPENFNAALGRRFAREDCIRQLWPLEGYLLREALHREGQ